MNDINLFFVRAATTLRAKSRLAHKSRIGSLSDLKSTARSYDQMARAQYLAGVLGDPISSLTRVRKWGQKLVSLSARLQAQGFSQNIIDDWVASSNKDLLGQAAISINKILGDADYSGVGAEDVLTSIVTGISPLLSGTTRFGGVPLPYHLGKKSGGRLYPLPSTAKSIAKGALQLSNDVRRSAQALDETSGDVFLDGADGAMNETLLDSLSQELYDDSSSLLDLFFTPGNLGLISRCVSSKISNKRLKEIWEVIVASDGTLLRVGKGDKIALKRNEAAAAFERLHGKAVSNISIGNSWTSGGDDVVDAMIECFTTDDIAEELRFTRDLKEHLHEERTKHRFWNRRGNRFDRLASRFAALRKETRR